MVTRGWIRKLLRVGGASFEFGDLGALAEGGVSEQDSRKVSEVRRVGRASSLCLLSHSPTLHHTGSLITAYRGGLEGSLHCHNLNISSEGPSYFG